MDELIKEIRSSIPFDMTEAQMCEGSCHGCSKKLLEFLDQTLEGCLQDLTNGEVPTLGDVSRLGRLAGKVYKVLKVNSLVEAQGLA